MDVPVNTPTTPSTRVDVTVVSSEGVKAYQTLWSKVREHPVDGCPRSRLAPLTSSVSLKGTAGIACALAKSSFAGAGIWVAENTRFPPGPPTPIDSVIPPGAENV